MQRKASKPFIYRKINNEKRTSILLFLTDIPLAYADDHLYCLTSPKIHHIVNVTPLA